MAPKQKRRRLERAPTIDSAAAIPFIQEASARKVQSAWYQDGSILRELAGQHAKVFGNIIPASKNCGHIEGIITWCSLCSGSEGAHHVMQECQTAINDMAEALGRGQVLFEQVYACESDASKRQWIDWVVNTDRRAQGKDPICIFVDIKDMGKTRAACTVHNKPEGCLIPHAEIGFVSTSCKDLSSLSLRKSSLSRAGSVLAMETSPGGSADTFRGFLNWLAHGAELVFYENSDNLADEKESKTNANMDVFMAETQSRDFETQCFLLNSKLFGVPQSRRRFFGILVKTSGQTLIEFSDRSVQDVFCTMRQLVQACQRVCPDAAELMLPDGDLRVETEFLARMSRGHPGVDPSRNWIREHQAQYDALRLPWGVVPPCSETASSPWLGTLTEAQKSLLTFHQYKALGAQPMNSAGNGRVPTRTRLMQDLAPSINRNNGSSFHENLQIAPCIVPTQVLFEGPGWTCKQ